ncbi:MAG: hypothetical protein FWG90_01425 [Oscillospiraceae bacterium]|nr:hypothetical protein [Oscillospiraceae bacterium]
MNIKKLLVSMVLALSLFTLSACSKSPDIESTYDGILSRVRLGMPLSQVVGMQRVGVELYYETDKIIWSVDEDIELMEIRSLLPEQQDEQMWFFVDSARAIITYYFQTLSGRNEMVLRGYSEQISCLLDREVGNTYFREKSAELRGRHDPHAEIRPVRTGVENIDFELNTTMSLSLPSYNLTFTMTETYDTVNGVTDYYVTHYKIEVMEKAVKDSTPA